jgi:hypothetical protein
MNRDTHPFSASDWLAPFKLVLGFLGLTAFHSCMADVDALALTLDLDRPVQVNLKKYGVNGSLLGAQIGYGSEKLEADYKRIGIAFNRFPGGTIGNFYQWRTGRFGCHRPPDAHSSPRIAQMNRSLEKSGTTYALADFLNFTRNVGGDFTYVLNTLCAPPEDNAALLEYMRTHNVKLNYLEMANEVYSGSYAWAYANAADYLDDAEKNYAAVRRFYPNARIGLVVSPIAFSAKNQPGKDGTPNRAWPERPRQFDLRSANAAFGDALIIHIYGHPHDGRFWSIAPKTDEQRYSRVMTQFNERFERSMSYLRKLGRGKPIWITEWGVTVPPDERQGPFRAYEKSAYQALFMASALTSITLEEGVEVANYHSIGNLWTAHRENIEITPPGKVLHLFIEAAKHASAAYDVRIASLKKKPANPTENLKALLFAAESSGELLVINEQDSGYTIHRLDTGRLDFKYFRVDTLKIENDAFATTSMADSDISALAQRGIEIRPFSITRIRLHKRASN